MYTLLFYHILHIDLYDLCIKESLSPRLSTEQQKQYTLQKILHVSAPFMIKNSNRSYTVRRLLFITFTTNRTV